LWDSTAGAKMITVTLEDAFNSLCEIPWARPDAGTGGWRPLSILFVRFLLPERLQNLIPPLLDFQFSLWDSVSGMRGLQGALPPRSATFQFSLWDSNAVFLLSPRPPSHTFNSLCEIRKSIRGLSGIPSRALSILFVRFLTGFMVKLKVKYHFQFSLWDSRATQYCRRCLKTFLSILFVRFRREEKDLRFIS